jgi:thiosulfate/3-mercaptopyruvate sulfurtransferase
MRRILAGLAAVAIAACAGTEAKRGIEPLVDAAWLNDNIADVVVLDIRWADDGVAYEDGHIPGAVHSSYRDDPWRTERNGVSGMLPPVDQLAELIGALGISNDDRVVIVPAGLSAAEFGAATRVFWQFKVLGHDEVAILNGGYAAWKRAGYPAETGVNEPAPAVFTASYRPELVASAEDVMAGLENGTSLIDARSSDYYTGQAKSRTADRYGTITGAVNVPYEQLTVEGGGTFIDAETAASLWAEAGLPASGEQIAFCNTGHLASLAWFAAHEVLGIEEARLYDGSIAEWSADPARPMDNTQASGTD